MKIFLLFCLSLCTIQRQKIDLLKKVELPDYLNEKDNNARIKSPQPDWSLLLDRSVHNKGTRGEKSRTCQEIKAVLLSSTWIPLLPNWQKPQIVFQEEDLDFESSHSQTNKPTSSNVSSSLLPLPPMPEQKSFFFANSHLDWHKETFLSCHEAKSWLTSFTRISSFFTEAVSAGDDAKGEDNIVLKINFWCWWVNWKLPKEKGQAGSPAHPKRLINDHYKINKMGFGRQQRLNAVDTDKYSHFGEKCTFIGTKCQGLKKLPTAVRAGHFILVVIC